MQRATTCRPWCWTKTTPSWILIGAAILLAILAHSQVIAASTSDVADGHKDGLKVETVHVRNRRSLSRVRATLSVDRMFFFIVRRWTRPMMMVRWISTFVNRVVMIVGIPFGPYVFRTPDSIVEDSVRFTGWHEQFDCETIISFILDSSKSSIRFSRSMPIFVDRSSRQTIVYSRAGGTFFLFNRFTLTDVSFLVHIFPPLINAHGKLLSVAELISYGYATLLSNGALMARSFDIASYTRPGACTY